MAKLKIMRTDGTCEEILKEYDNEKVIHLFIGSFDNLDSNTDHELGDLLISEENENKLALLVKEFTSGKIITASLRVAVMELLLYIKENNYKQDCIVISKNTFNSNREEAEFVCTMQEFMYMLCNDDKIVKSNSATEEVKESENKDDEIISEEEIGDVLSLVITDHKSTLKESLSSKKFGKKKDKKKKKK